MLKKIINLVTVINLSLVATQSLALAPQDKDMVYSSPLHGFYIEGAGGWAFSNWRSSFNYIFQGQTGAQFTNLKGGGTYGGDVGYKLNPYFAFEVGAFGLPKVSYAIQGASIKGSVSDNGTISNWLIDFAGKVTLPVSKIPGLDVFGKFGAAYRAGNFSDNNVQDGVTITAIQATVFNIIEPILGGGLQYHLNEKWWINAQYLFLPYGILSTTVLGVNQADHISIPTAQLLTAGISYNF